MGRDVPIHRELDADIIHQALWGDPPQSGRAFVQIYEHYGERVRFAVAKAALRWRHIHRIDELRQEVWCRLLDRDRKLLRYYEPERGPFGTFLCRLAYQQGRAAARVDRRQEAGGKREAYLEDEVEDEQAEAFVAELAQRELYRKVLARAKAEVDTIDGVVLREVYLAGRSIADVASEYGVTADRLYKRNERLKKKLEAWGEELLASLGPVAADASSASTLVVVLILAGLAGLADAGVEPAPAPVFASPVSASPVSASPISASLVSASLVSASPVSAPSLLSALLR